MVKWYLWIKMTKRDQVFSFSILWLRLTICCYAFKLRHFKNDYLFLEGEIQAESQRGAKNGA